jgi:uncharacterized protein YfaS (alpha-2-macroglobulin family)
VLLPSTLYSGTVATLSAHEVTQPLTLNLVKSSTGDSVSTVQIPAAATAQVVQLPVPAGWAGAAEVHVTDAGGRAVGSYPTVQVTGAALGLLLELDKPIYRPGQAVRARVLAVDPYLKPVPNSTAVVEVYDPAGFIVERWTTTLDALGVGTFTFVTSSDGSLGTYRLKATSSVDGNGEPLGTVVETESSFELDKYVSPKFEVNVTTLYATRVSSSGSLSGAVMAEYTYGSTPSVCELTLLGGPSGCFDGRGLPTSRLSQVHSS